MRINTNIGALNAYRNLSETNNAVASSMQKLSSGFRINKAGDDAAGLGIANKLRADTRAMTQASKNAEQANSVLQIAEGATGSIQKMLERMKELATQAGSDSVDDGGRSRIKAEYDELVGEIGRTVSTTKFQGKFLLDGTAGDLQFLVSSSGDYAGKDLLTVSAIDLTAGATGLGLDAVVFAAPTATTTAEWRTALTTIDAAMDKVNTVLGDIGATQNRVEFAQSNIKTSIQNFSAAESVIRDLDMAEEMTKFSKNNILAQAGTAMLAQANQSAQGVLQLLRG